MIIDHIGIVTKSLEKGLNLWTDAFGYKKKAAPVINIRQKVKVVFLAKLGSIDIKRLEPVEESSPVHRFALKGGGLHHLCFKCDSLESNLADLNSSGLRILPVQEPGKEFGNANIAFIYATQGFNFELIDTCKGASKLEKRVQNDGL